MSDAIYRVIGESWTITTSAVFRSGICDPINAGLMLPETFFSVTHRSLMQPAAWAVRDGNIRFTCMAHSYSGSSLSVENGTERNW